MREIHYTNLPVKIKDILNPDKFTIPPFQRDVVWSDTRKEEFIRNLLDGDPFGVLLIQEEGNKYKLIDGLQRITTIQDFNRNPYKYLNYKDIDSNLVDKLIEADRTEKNLQVTKEIIKENREKWKKQIFEKLKEGGTNIKTTAIINSLTNDNNFNLSSDEETWDCVEEVVDDFKEFIDLSRLEVYAINYEGDEERLAKVFDNLNTGGMKLTKYETLSAEWSDDKFIVKDEELIDIIVDRYEALKEKSRMDVDYSRGDLIDEGINLHQYCRAIGTIITNEKDGFNILFGTSGKLVEKIGFEILALLLVGIVNGTDEMHNKLVRDNNVEGEFLVQLKDAIKESLVEIKDALEPYLVGMNQSYLRSDRVYLTYHILVSYIKEYYFFDFDAGKVIKNPNSTLNVENFRKFVPLHYLHDCINGYWKDHRQTSEINKAVADKTMRQKYWWDVEDDEWDDALDKFIESQKSVGKSVPQQNKLFVDFLTRLKISENSDYEEFFTKDKFTNKKHPLDIEHIVPQKVLLNRIEQLDGEEPLVRISAVGNLCYLTAKSNRGKKHFTLHEFMEGRPEYVMNSDFKDCILYPTEEELKFKDYPNETFFDEYEKFIDERQDKLKEEFLRLIKEL